jgi:hypothetical protein
VDWLSYRMVRRWNAAHPTISPLADQHKPPESETGERERARLRDHRKTENCSDCSPIYAVCTVNVEAKNIAGGDGEERETALHGWSIVVGNLVERPVKEKAKPVEGSVALVEALVIPCKRHYPAGNGANRELNDAFIGEWIESARYIGFGHFTTDEGHRIGWRECHAATEVKAASGRRARQRGGPSGRDRRARRNWPLQVAQRSGKIR